MGRITLYGWLQYDNTLFDNIRLPDGLKRELLVNEIIKRSGDLFTYYQVPTMLKTNITNWFETQFENFDQITRSLLVKYEPLDNYDRTEIHKTKHTNSGMDKSTTELGSSATNTHTGEQGEEHEVSAFDTADYSPANRNTQSFNDTVTTTNAGSDVAKTEYGHIVETEDELKVFGNIGVTPNSRVLDEEVVLRMKFNVYEIIAKMFESEFLVQIY